MQRFWVVILLLLATLPISAHDEPTPVISADNVAQLQSVQHINFADFDAEFDTGWFAVSSGVAYDLRPFYGSSTTYIAAVTTDQSIVIFDTNGNLLNLCPPLLLQNETMRAVDLYFSSTLDTLLGLFSGAGRYQLAYLSLYNCMPIVITLDELWNLSASDVPVAGWLYVNDSGPSPSYDTYFEIQGDTDRVVSFLSYASGELVKGSPEGAPFIFERDYLPAQDPEAVVRIGRIPLPYVVTSSETGIVKLWNIQTGEILYEVDNGTGQPSVFGNINADATHFVWRDNASETLYLLDFETGENREVAQLNGEYAQWFFLSNDASTILAVNLNFEPIVVAWDVETGEKTVLGEYRQCNRPQPDMARLSRDGTTLVIGCDTGLDVWRIVEDE